MSQALLIRIVTDHGIRHRTFNGQLQVEDVCTVLRPSGYKAKRSWLSVEGWTLRKLTIWLGY